MVVLLIILSALIQKMAFGKKVAKTNEFREHIACTVLEENSVVSGGKFEIISSLWIQLRLMISHMIHSNIFSTWLKIELVIVWLQWKTKHLLSNMVCTWSFWFYWQKVC